MTATVTEQTAAMSDHIIRTALDTVAIEARLRVVVSDAIENAPGLATWWSGRLASLRLP